MKFKFLINKNNTINGYRNELLNNALGLFSIASSINLCFIIYQALPINKPFYIVLHSMAVIIFILLWLIRNQLSYQLKISGIFICTYLIVFSTFFYFGLTSNSRAGIVVILLIAALFLDQPYLTIILITTFIGLLIINYLALHNAITLSMINKNSLIEWLNMDFVVFGGGGFVAWLTRSMMNELIFCRQVAETANHAKSQFLTHVSHELRTPLNIILGFTQILLEQGNHLTPIQYQQLNLIAKNADSLHHLISDLLDLEHAEKGVFKLNLKSFSLSQLINDVSEMVRYDCEKKGLILEVNFLDFKQQLLIDGERLKQIMLNLLTNAIKFTTQGKIKLSVEIHLISDSQLHLIISVIDSGIGIALADQERIFLPFEQIHHFNQKNSLGLGLAISRQLAQLMGGELTVNSVINQGSCFRLILPSIIILDKKYPALLTQVETNKLSEQDLPLASDIALLSELVECRMLSDIQDWLQINALSYPQFCGVLDELVNQCDFIEIENFLKNLDS